MNLLLGGHLIGNHTLLIPNVGVGAELEQKRAHFETPADRREVQRGVALLVGSVGLGSRLQQQLQDVRFRVVPRGLEERGASVDVDLVDVGVGEE